MKRRPRVFWPWVLAVAAASVCTQGSRAADHANARCAPSAQEAARQEDRDERHEAGNAPQTNASPILRADLQPVAQAAPQPGAPLGFRLIGLHSDVLRGRAWAVVESCSDPSAPLIGIPVSNAFLLSHRGSAVPRDNGGTGTARFSTSEAAAGAASAVRAGEPVRIINANANSQMELQGRAIESGGAGELIDVRLPRLNPDSAEAPRVLRCRVIGAGLAEVVLP